MATFPSSLHPDPAKTRVEMVCPKPSVVYRVGKRLFDLLLAFCGFLFLSPLLAVLALLIKISSPGPILYKGVRSGLLGKPFHILKFRSMLVNAEQIGGHSTALNDPRLTPIGKFLRRYKLDEIPQLINILKGEMCFVGPRPQVEKYTHLYKGEEKCILSVRPGLTDFSSIHFINLDTILGDDNVDEKYLAEIEPLKNRLRIKYVREQSFSVDIKILLSTILYVLKIKLPWNTEH